MHGSITSLVVSRDFPRAETLLTVSHLSLKYPASEAPFYTRGHEIMLGYTILGFFAALAFRTSLRLENNRRDRGERDEIIFGSGSPQECKSVRNGCFESIEAAQRDKGDEFSGFRYTL